MKVFFETPVNAWIDAPGNRREWEIFLASVISNAPPGSIATDAAVADVVIHSSNEQIGDRCTASLIRPLAKADIERFVWDWGDRPTGRHSGFYCSLPSSLFDADRHRTFCYPIAFNEMIEEFPQPDAKYNFGFIGGLTAGVRGRLFRYLRPRESSDNAIYKIQGADWHKVSDRNGSSIKDEYADFLRTTKFILCPRGYGVGTARLFEAMKAGRVPVIISNGYVPPAGIDWTACSIAIRENEISTLPVVLAARLQDWPQMASAARAAWEHNFSEHHLIRNMLEQLKKMRGSAVRTDLAYRISYSVRIVGILTSQKIRPSVGRMRRRLTSLTNPATAFSKPSRPSQDF